MRPQATALILVFTVLVGCSAMPGHHHTPSTRSYRELIDRHGGACDDPVLASRADQAVYRLLGAGGTDQARVVVLDCDQLRAYAWPGGTVLVSRGLVEHDEPGLLVAAIAHECGHLIADQHIATPAALVGDPAINDPDPEVIADDLAVRLLQDAGYDAGAMSDLLRVLMDDPGLTPARREAIDQRRARLEVQVTSIRP